MDDDEDWQPDEAWDELCRIALEKLRTDPAFDVPDPEPVDERRLYIGRVPYRRKIVLSS